MWKQASFDCSQHVISETFRYARRAILSVEYINSEKYV